MGCGGGRPREDMEPITRSKVDFSSSTFTLNNAQVDVRVRSGGVVRVGCHTVTRAALEELLRISKLSE